MLLISECNASLVALLQRLSVAATSVLQRRACCSGVLQNNFQLSSSRGCAFFLPTFLLFTFSSSTSPKPGFFFPFTPTMHSRVLLSAAATLLLLAVPVTPLGCLNEQGVCTCSAVPLGVAMAANQTLHAKPPIP